MISYFFPKRLFCSRRGGLGVESPVFCLRATTFLVLTALNSVLPELVILISTNNSTGVMFHCLFFSDAPRSQLFHRSYSNKHTCIMAWPAARAPERERERESFIRNNLHNGVVSGAGLTRQGGKHTLQRPKARLLDSELVIRVSSP